MVSAQLKMLIDRSVSIYEKDMLKNKIGAAVVTYGVQGQAGRMVTLFIGNFYDANNMLYAGRVIGESGAEIGHIKKNLRALQRFKEVANE